MSDHQALKKQINGPSPDLESLDQRLYKIDQFAWQEEFADQ